MQREGFIIYKSFYEPLKILSDEQLGKLFRAIFEYQVNGIEEVDPDIKMAFEFFKNQFRLDDDKYQKIVERNKINGSKGGRPKTQENPKNPVGLKKPKKADKDKEKDKEKDNNIIIVEQIINYMNELAKTNFKTTTTKTRSLIKARLKEGFTTDDLKDVVYYKYHEWYKEPFEFKNGVSSDTYFRPNTLFGTKFEEYLQQYNKNIPEVK